jgi:hypothetical protein
MKDAVSGHPYLERALPASLLAHDRFAGQVRIDDRGNAVFPHFDAQGLSQYELKNVGFTGFASGGQEGTLAVTSRNSVSTICATLLRPGT